MPVERCKAQRSKQQSDSQAKKAYTQEEHHILVVYNQNRHYHYGKGNAEEIA